VDPAVALEHVTVRFRVSRERIGSLKEYAIRRLKHRFFYDEFTALQDVSMRIAPGDSVGLIGRNGAGKSTLLRVMARVIRPTEGRVVVDGLVAPILELGLGFHGELTGRENVLLQGALLGFSRAEMRRRLDGIVAFAELEDFIEAPIRTYSSGMSARLAFAVATDVDPDILLIDEALAVGDERFRIKCETRMRSFRDAGKTILFVSHSTQQVRDTCARAIWIHQGSVVQDGDAQTVTGNYHEWSIAGDPVPPDEFVATRPAAGSGSRWYSPPVSDSRLAGDGRTVAP